MVGCLFTAVMCCIAEFQSFKYCPMFALGCTWQFEELRSQTISWCWLFMCFEVCGFVMAHLGLQIQILKPCHCRQFPWVGTFPIVKVFCAWVVMYVSVMFMRSFGSTSWAPQWNHAILWIWSKTSPRIKPFPMFFSHWSSRLSGMRLRFQKWPRPIYAVLGIFCVILPLGSQGEAGAQANKLSKNWDVGHPLHQTSKM